MKQVNRKLFSRKHWRYYVSEVTAYLTGLAAAGLSAHFADSAFESDLLITVISTLCGTIGFLIPALGLFLVLNIGVYRRDERTLSSDLKRITQSYFEGLIATYMVRIPLQFILQKFIHIDPAAAAPIAQTLAGQIGNVVRIYGNYQRKVFGSYDSSEPKHHTSHS